MTSETTVLLLMLLVAVIIMISHAEYWSFTSIITTWVDVFGHFCF